ncbi:MULTISPECIES: L-2-hydroxyglutarate oxidase [Pseudonocardia]|uniref:L-2-hydroxyglutarate oxidase LhgO n=2 Tax=Pseudonocardia TaxID=1847 RepID=A0A1Y2MWS8_PSEAH|nr:MULTISPECIES: L-2-hydroxyglutarate oxidase [Pseudonocardia]OSY39613.1 L-2-hydroxyglutarate oxidase LhgO [Pseudonocardia autotrophica]TDN72744.1 L-2-hydroxyglutarate oxidase [Pseudonocardia autotrophica]BBG03459.1 hydroxyglutarate oxidase [Pseudonocardia autotrophica]GEC24879.1 hydroxyglutarate oxidase [Pseudonocardia saturnea]
MAGSDRDGSTGSAPAGAGLPATPSYDLVVVGGGIVGLATAFAATNAGLSVAVVEREPRLANHQTGNNSNVIHSGLYYAPGGYKARLAVAGCAETVAFCREYDLPHQVCGKLVVATEPEELPRLDALARRGEANGVENHRLDEHGMKTYEPDVRGLAALWVPSTGICDYRSVAEKLGELVEKGGGEVHLGRAVTGFARRPSDVVVRTSGGDLLGKRVVVCGGLRCDELATLAGADPGVRIVPFRGEYSGFSERAASLVRGLIYPVPDPEFPFLGVHATRGIDGHVHAGPNAVLAMAREGYDWRTIRPAELLGTLTYPGMIRIARKHWRYGIGEVQRSLSRKAMVRQIQRMLPDVTAEDLHPAGAGVRAQAVKADGTLVDDFLFLDQPGSDGAGGAGSILHVLNAPSPAATAALPIGREILGRLGAAA